MGKETFLYEVIDQYLYLACLGCMVKENYYLLDGSDDYVNLIDTLNEMMKFYDKMREKVNCDIYNDDDEDSMLNYLIVRMKNHAMINIEHILIRITESSLGDEAREYIKSHLYKGKNEKRREFNREFLMNYIIELRELEEKGVGGNVV